MTGPSCPVTGLLGTPSHLFLGFSGSSVVSFLICTHRPAARPHLPRALALAPVPLLSGASVVGLAGLA